MADSKAKPKGKKRRVRKDHVLRVPMSDALFLVLAREAKRDQRSAANLARKLLTDGLVARDCFNPNVTAK